MWRLRLPTFPGKPASQSEALLPRSLRRSAAGPAWQMGEKLWILISDAWAGGRRLRSFRPHRFRKFCGGPGAFLIAHDQLTSSNISCLLVREAMALKDIVQTRASVMRNVLVVIAPRHQKTVERFDYPP